MQQRYVVISRFSSFLLLLVTGCIIQQQPPPTAQQIAAQIERDYANSQPPVAASTPQDGQSSGSASTDENPRQPSENAQEQALAALKGLSTDAGIQVASKVLFLEQSSFISQGFAGDETNAMGSIASALKGIGTENDDQVGQGFALLCTTNNMQWAPIVAANLEHVGKKPWTASESSGLTDQQMADYDTYVKYTSHIVESMPDICSKLIAAAQQERRHAKHHKPANSAPPLTGMHTL